MIYEAYIKEYNIKEKTEEEQKLEIIKSIIETKKELANIGANYEYAEEGLIDFYSYQMKAYQAKLNYLLKKAKNYGILLDRIQELEIRKIEDSKVV